MKRLHSIFALALVTGCPGEEEQPPTADETGTSGPTTTAPTTTLPTTTAPSTTDEPTTTGPTTGETETDSSDTENPDCAAEGCWSCPPEQPEHFLNACTDASCEPFENSPKRLPLLEQDGTLPPLP